MRRRDSKRARMSEGVSSSGEVSVKGRLRTVRRVFSWARRVAASGRLDSAFWIHFFCKLF